LLKSWRKKLKINMGSIILKPSEPDISKSGHSESLGKEGEMA
jgi:hypothetical protein